VDTAQEGGSAAPSEPSEVLLSSELAAPGDTPTDIVEELIEALPVARDCRSALERYGAAMGRFESDHKRVKTALVEGILIPLVAAAQTEEERVEALEVLQRTLDSSQESSRSLVSLEKRLRLRLS